MKKLDESILVLFGATGDLAKRKLLPGLFLLHVRKKLPEKFAVIGIGRKPFTDETFRDYLKENLRKAAKISQHELDAFVARISYLIADISKQEDFQKIADSINSLRKSGIKNNLIFYLALEPNLFGETAIKLKRAGLTKENNNWVRVALEKPFGNDFDSASRLKKTVYSVFKDGQIYHVDHYLGKESVQSIIPTRFKNEMLEQMWNSKFIDHVQITDLEKLGIEGRVHYYENTGALKDMVQNHLLQILALVAIEPPTSFQSKYTRKEKVKVFHSLAVPKKISKSAVRGQYGSGLGKVGYAEEMGRKSDTETYAALKLEVTNPRWRRVPFYVRTGKRIGKDLAEVNVVFKGKSNVLTIQMKPNERIKIKYNKKSEIGKKLQLAEKKLYKLVPLRIPYECLLFDIIAGDKTLFVGWDEIKLSWKLIDAVKDAWSKEKPKFPNYRTGSLGPLEASKLIEKDGRRWIN